MIDAVLTLVLIGDNVSDLEMLPSFAQPVTPHIAASHTTVELSGALTLLPDCGAVHTQRTLKDEGSTRTERSGEFCARLVALLRSPSG